MHLDGVAWFEPGRSSVLQGFLLRVGPARVTLSRDLAEAMEGKSWHVGTRKQDGKIVLFAQPGAKGVNVMVTRAERRLGGRALATFLRAQGIPDGWSEAHVQRVGKDAGTVRVEWPLAEVME